MGKEAKARAWPWPGLDQKAQTGPGLGQARVLEWVRWHRQDALTNGYPCFAPARFPPREPSHRHMPPTSPHTHTVVKRPDPVFRVANRAWQPHHCLFCTTQGRCGTSTQASALPSGRAHAIPCAPEMPREKKSRTRRFFGRCQEVSVFVSKIAQWGPFGLKLYDHV